MNKVIASHRSDQLANADLAAPLFRTKDAIVSSQVLRKDVRAAPRSGQTSGIKIEVLGDLFKAAPAWKAFEAIADCSPFQTCQWLEKWQRHVGKRTGAIPAIVFGRDERGDVLFVFPFAIQARGPLRYLTWLGTDLGDYNAPLLAPGFAAHPAAQHFAQIWQSVVRELRNSGFRFDAVDLEKMPETVGGQKNPFLSFNVQTHRSGAYLATLKGDNWDEYYAATRSAATRKTARRKQKQLEVHGKLNFVTVRDLGEARRTIETLIEQKTCWFERVGVKSIFQRPGYPDFYLDLATDPALSDLVHLSRLDVGDATGSTGIGLRHRGRYYLILSSYNPGEMSRFGPGTTHLHELLRSAIEHRFHTFDFTIGDELYKRDWSDIQLTLYDYLGGQTLRGHVAVAVEFFRAATEAPDQANSGLVAFGRLDARREGALCWPYNRQRRCPIIAVKR